MEYGKCLATLTKYKKQLPPLFRDFFENGPVMGFGEMLKLDVNSWDFFIKSLDYLKSYLTAFDRNNPDHTKLYYFFAKQFEKKFENWTNTPYLKCLIAFAKAAKGKNVRHYYIETQALCDFLTAVEVKNIKDMMQYIQQLDGTVTFAFHLPRNESFSINLKIKNDRIKTIYETNGEFSLVQMPEDADLLEFINCNLGLKICFNAISYTECFSENVRDGVPADMKEKTPKSENPKTLSPFKEIENFSKKEITAHFRHAHFRFCGSDWFKAKKGKWVFVKGSMVNAEAQTIIEDK